MADDRNEEQPRDAAEKEKDLKKVLAKPPKDKREVTIGPTNGVGPDVTLG